jgi:hypothetical protein
MPGFRFMQVMTFIMSFPPYPSAADTISQGGGFVISAHRLQILVTQY